MMTYKIQKLDVEKRIMNTIYLLILLSGLSEL